MNFIHGKDTENGKIAYEPDGTGSSGSGRNGNIQDHGSKLPWENLITEESQCRSNKGLH